MSQRINLYAAFTGLTFLPLPLVIASNSFSPKLILHDDQLEYRVLRTSQVGYDQIASVDVLIVYKTTNLVLTWHDSVFTFMGNLNDPARLRDVVRFLRAKGCPLTDRAQQFVQTDPGA